MAKTAGERLAENKEPKKVVLEKNFAGVSKGSLLFVGTPQIVADYMRRIPYGQTRTIDRMRRELARRRKCDATCPVSTAIFIRIAAQAAIDEMDGGTPVTDVIPFWRLIAPEDKVANKLTIEREWIETQRNIETGTA